MPIQLSSPVTDLPRIGPAKAKFLKKLGITHARDFVYTWPRRYDDFSTITPIAELKVGERATIHGTIKTASAQRGFRGRQRLLRIFATITDETGELSVMWFNLTFLEKQLTKGRELSLAGDVEEAVNKKTGKKYLRMRSPVIEFADAANEGLHTGRITPVYPETFGITSRFLRTYVQQLLPLTDRLPEYLPEGVQKRNGLMGIREAVRAIHFPESSKNITEAQKRLRFDELFFLQLAALVRRQQRTKQEAHSLPTNQEQLRAFEKTLSFSFTDAQREALKEINADVARDEPMNRLLQGDVGSGKSVVALWAAHTTLEAGHSVLYLAPTEVLARQQAASFTEQLGVENVELLVGALTAVEKQRIKKRLAGTEPVCVVGTHTLLQEDVEADNVALVIVDEQHRFGVAQRKVLTEYGGKKTPHLLSMTATPIPRTLNLTVYGDLDVSVLNELPKGRKPIETKLVTPKDRDAAVIHILEELHAGRQGFVIAPLVEESEKLQQKSAKETYEEMKQLFPDIAVGLVHGQMKSEEKEAAMNNFAAGAIQLLVATAVVEVGVNVPNATVMIIEGAERFGLAQLHQFRGRIGRGSEQSYCYLFPTEEAGANNQRLQILASTTDGFKIAEEDLKLRGPGEVYGVAQSGFGDLKVASLLDYDTIKRARSEAELILKKDPELKDHPILKGKVEQKNLITHFE